MPDAAGGAGERGRELRRAGAADPQAGAAAGGRRADRVPGLDRGPRAVAAAGGGVRVVPQADRAGPEGAGRRGPPRRSGRPPGSRCSWSARTPSAACAARGTGCRWRRPWPSGIPGQVWETTHVGGHRFAANLVILPHGLYYGPVGLEAATAAIGAYQRGAVALDRYRGRAGYPQAGAGGRSRTAGLVGFAPGGGARLGFARERGASGVARDGRASGVARERGSGLREDGGPRLGLPGLCRSRPTGWRRARGRRPRLGRAGPRPR